MLYLPEFLDLIVGKLFSVTIGVQHGVVFLKWIILCDFSFLPSLIEPLPDNGAILIHIDAFTSVGPGIITLGSQ